MSESNPEAAIHRMQRPGDFFSREEMTRLRERHPLRSTWMLVHCWAVIVGTWTICILWPHPLLILLGIMIVGTRQLGLFVLAHDAAHYLFYDNKRLNDWAAEWICNRPLLEGSIDAYRRHHLGHHQHTQQDDDPDLYLSAPFPVTPRSMRRKIWRDLTGQTSLKLDGALIRNAFGAPGEPFQERWRAGLRQLGPNLLINLVFLIGFALAGAWYLYFLLWLLPAMTWRLLVTRLRNIAEHACVPDNDDRLRNTRTTHANWLARALIAPYHVNYHLEHHLLVSAPAYQLPLAHRMLVEKGLAPRMEIQPGYLAVLRSAASAPEAS